MRSLLHGGSHAIVVGIAGGSGSGKTTVARRIQAALGETDVTILDHTRYYRDHQLVSAGERTGFNYDHPDSFDTNLLVEHVRALRDGQDVQAPLYNCSLGARKTETTPMRPAPTIIVDGILVLADDTLRSLMDVKVFVDVDPDIRFIRRLERDMAERGRSLSSVIDQYVTTVKPMHQEFVEPTRRYADVIIPDGGHNQAAVELLATLIRSYFPRLTAST